MSQILFTGASAGIGASCAILFSKLGANLIITGRNEANLMAVKDECLKQSEGQEVQSFAILGYFRLTCESIILIFVKPLVLLGDLGKEADCENIVKSAIEKFKRIDILVCSTHF